MGTKLIQDDRGPNFIFSRKSNIILGSWPTTNFSMSIPKAFKFIVKAYLNSNINI